MAPKKNRIRFVERYALNDSVLELNPTSSEVRCFVTIPFVVKNTGVRIPKITGTIDGILSEGGISIHYEKLECLCAYY